MIKKKYKIKGMDCPSCAMVIEGELEDAGINASCSYAKEELTLEFDEAKVKEEDIKKIVKEQGYEIVD